MSVHILYCEGYPNSYDVRLLNFLLFNTGCRAVPAGGKDNFFIGVRMMRNSRHTGGQGIYALRDRDFDAQATEPCEEVLRWSIQDRRTSIHLGWKWERREIENYLLDPLVIEKALPAEKLNVADYRQALEGAASRLEFYTAARIAISLSRHSDRLKNTFSPFSTADECRQKIKEIIRQYRTNTPEEKEVLDHFDLLLPECQAGGIRRTHFTTYFSGKDLFTRLNPFLTRNGWGSQDKFIEEILDGMKNTAENIWEWLPEWKHLRKQISSTIP
ncbi:MAG: DUF4435 domain-containing protein [Gammaproteobacteria bacterium]|nr:DUF4435 domain-containing protein [Gammaproteobacteria bacterium]